MDYLTLSTHDSVNEWANRLPEKLLEISNLRTYFFTEAGVVKALDGMSLEVNKGQAVGLVGESGSGKSVTAQSVLRIVPRPGRIVDGSIKFEGEELLSKSDDEMRKLRGPKMAIVFQDPTTSLNPVFTVEKQLTDILMLHRDLTKDAASKRALSLLEHVGIQEPEKRLNAYPHELSGGMKQRIAIARALSCEPVLLFADEPTTNLDVTIQAQVLELLKQLQRELNMTMVMITHDMGIIADMTERCHGSLRRQGDGSCRYTHVISLAEASLHRSLAQSCTKRKTNADPRGYPWEYTQSHRTSLRMRIQSSMQVREGRLHETGASPGESGGRALCGLPLLAGLEPRR